MNMVPIIALCVGSLGVIVLIAQDFAIDTASPQGLIAAE